MTEESSQPIEEVSQRFASGSVWMLFVALLGVSLWAQIFLLAAVDEFQFSDQSTLTTLAYMLPLLVLVPATYLRVFPLILLVFPASLIPGLLLMPPRHLLALEGPWDMARIGVTLAAYLGTAAATSMAAQQVGTVDTQRLGEPRRVEGTYPFFFAVRALLLVGLLLVTQYAVFQDPAIAATIADNYPKRPQSAATFIGLFVFFAWCVAAYTMFFVPLMNLEYDVRSLARSLQESVVGSRRSIWRRLGLLGASLVVALAVGVGFVY